jgi:hypothetical protein
MKKDNRMTEDDWKFVTNANGIMMSDEEWDEKRKTMSPAEINLMGLFEMHTTPKQSLKD